MNRPQNDRAPGGARMQKGGEWAEQLAPGAPGSAGESAAKPEPPTKEKERPRTDSDEKVDEASKESFPASDPPSFTPGKIG